MRDARSRPNLSRQPGHELLEAGVADGDALRADHDHIGRPLAGRRTQRLAVQGFGLAGLRRPHHMGTCRKAAERGAHENQRRYHGDPPDCQHTARPPRAATGCVGGRTRNPEPGASWPTSSDFREESLCITVS
jgi:hypothetical protein